MLLVLFSAECTHKPIVFERQLAQEAFSFLRQRPNLTKNLLPFYWWQGNVPAFDLCDRQRRNRCPDTGKLGNTL